MSRPLISLAVALVVLGSIARLTCGGERAPLAAPDAPAVVSGPYASSALVEPENAVEERSVAAASLDAPEDGAAREQEAEDVDAELPLLLSGMVIEGRGVGVPDATVKLERHIADTGGFGMRMVEVQPLPRLTTRTDAEGRFEVRGVETGEVVVLAEKQGYVLHEELEVTLPATRVTLVLEPGGAILVTAAPDARELTDQVYVEVRAPGVDHDVDRAVGSFRAGRALREHLVPGTYDVVFVGRLSRRLLHSVPGVQVRAGETTQDPRLQDLDLDAWLDRIRITVVDPEDRPMPGVTVHVHQKYGTTGRATDEEGAIELGAGADGVDVSVRETGWRQVRHDAVTEDLVIRLQRPLTLRLLRPAGRSAELGDLYLYVEPVLPEGDPRASVANRDWSLPAGEDAVDVAIDAPGTFRVQWAVTVDFAGRGTSNFFPRDAPPQVIEFPAEAGTMEVVLTLDPDAVDELLARLGPLVAELEQQPGETSDEHERRVMEVLLRENRRR